MSDNKRSKINTTIDDEEGSTRMNLRKRGKVENVAYESVLIYVMVTSSVT